MKKIHNVAILFAVCAGTFGADAAFGASKAFDRTFKREIERGLSTVGTQYTGVAETQYAANTISTNVYDGGYGELGQEVFYDVPSKNNDDKYEVFIPTSMYVRMGGGVSLTLATKNARVGSDKHKSDWSWNATIGLGWNMSSYVRTELAFQESTFKFKDLSDMRASYHTLNGMLYFDFLRRYVQIGDITYRRVFVPFMGLGVGLGAYDFVGPDGADGFVAAAPRAELGMTFMLNDIVGIDVAYQYQMFIGNGFGWNTHSSADSVSNIMATIRANF